MAGRVVMKFRIEINCHATERTFCDDTKKRKLSGRATAGKEYFAAWIVLLIVDIVTICLQNHFGDIITTYYLWWYLMIFK